MHQRYFYSLRGVILRQQKEVMGSGLENTFKNHAKEHSGHGNNFFFYFIFYFTTLFFLIHHFSHYLVANLFFPHKITKFLKIVKIPCEKSLFDRKINI